MTDEPKWFRPNYRPPEPKPTRVSCGPSSSACQVKHRCPANSAFTASPTGWRAQFLERGELFLSRGAFVTRADAVRLAEEMRRAMESEHWSDPLRPVPMPCLVAPADERLAT
jgi:hypothetical protein